jgi:hypothetical protein
MSSKTEDGEGEEARKDDAATTFTTTSDASSREMATRDGVVQGRFIVGGELVE